MVITAASTQPARHGRKSVPAFFLRFSRPDHGGSSLFGTHVVVRLVLGCQEFPTARWIHGVRTRVFWWVTLSQGNSE